MEQKKRNLKKHHNPEDVGETILQITQTKQEKQKNTPLIILKWVFFPITIVILLFRYIFTTQKVRLTTKTTVIFTAIYGVLITAYIIFVLLFFKDYLKSMQVDLGGFFVNIVIISIALGVVFVIVGSAAGALISNAMLRPIRKMITEIDKIDGDNLSLRLKPLDSQDEIMELIEQINQMLSSLEESFERQSNFVSDASHELKTPLSVISGYGDLLDRWGKDDPSILKEGITAIKREGAYMAKIIDQMLLLARLGRFAMHKQRIDVFDMLKQIVEGYNVISNDYVISIFGEECFVDCDKTLLTEAVRAIIDNAIKYTLNHGKIVVQVNHYQNMETDYVKIQISDNGVGIDEDDIPYLFDRFYRCDKTRGREKGSAGLGLTICKNIIEMMDGQINVVSKKGEGTQFTITL